jgi:hypothetical protein
VNEARIGAIPANPDRILHCLRGSAIPRISCSACGFLCRSTNDGEIIPVDKLNRRDWRFALAGPPDVAIGREGPLCFVSAHEICTVDTPAKDVNALLQVERLCPSFIPWKQGYSPKEHQTMLVAEEARARDREWQAEQREFERRWQTEMKAQDERQHETRVADDRKWREAQEEKTRAFQLEQNRVNRRYQVALAVVGVVGGVLFTLLGVWLKK